MFYRRFSLSLAALALALTLGSATFATGVKEIPADKNNKTQRNAVVSEPLNLAVLLQDDLVSQVGNELDRTAEFIRSLPNGSRVMVGYITSGSLQVRQPFTTDLNRAAHSLRIPIGSTSASAYNPYVEVIEALKKFDSSWQGHNAVLLISDG